MSISVFDLFKIGIGPSSSHTVGPMVAARKFASFLNETNHLNSVNRVTVELFGSLGLTGKGHGSGKAVVLGLEGELPDTVDVDSIKQRIAKIETTQHLMLFMQQDINFEIKKDLIFNRKESLPGHANGMKCCAYDIKQKIIAEKYYYSVGGGFVVEGIDAVSSLDDLVISEQLPLPYVFNTGEALLLLCEKHQKSIADIVFENEKTIHAEEKIAEQLDQIWSVMQQCVTRGCEQDGQLPGGLKVNRRAKKLHEQLKKQDKSSSVSQKDPLDVLDWVTLYALAVNEENASGGRIVTAPTNGAAGIVPAVLHYYINFIEGASTKGIHEFLLTAAAIGFLFKENASISGAEVGCQGEVGSACSMAAAGLTAVLGGSPKQVENAAEIAMEHHLGLTCDPIGGLVQIPCIERNAVASVNAIHAARMALRNDGSHFVSLDKVIKTMRETGKDMLEKYKETSRGGLATHVIEVPVNIIEC